MSQNLTIPKLRYLELRDRKSVQEWNNVYCDIPGMTIMLSGNMKYNINGIHYLLHTGSILHYNVGDVINRPAQTANVRYIALSYFPNNTQYIIKNHIQMNEICQNHLLYLLQKYGLEIHFNTETDRHISNMILDIFLRELEQISCLSDVDSIILDIKNYILQNYMNKISTTDVAKAVSLHPSYNGHRNQAIHLHGHSHFSDEADYEIDLADHLNALGICNEIYNVGCMYWNYEPVTLDEIIRHGRTVRPNYGTRCTEERETDNA